MFYQSIQPTKCNYYESPNSHTFWWFGAKTLNLEPLKWYTGRDGIIDIPKNMLNLFFDPFQEILANLICWLGQCFCSVEMSLKLACQIFLLVILCFLKCFYPRYSGQGWAFKKEICWKKRILFWLECEIQFQSLVAPLGCSTLTWHIW